MLPEDVLPEECNTEVSRDEDDDSGAEDVLPEDVLPEDCDTVFVVVVVLVDARCKFARLPQSLRGLSMGHK